MSVTDSDFCIPAVFIGVWIIAAALMLGACDAGAPVHSGESGYTDDAGPTSEPAEDDSSDVGNGLPQDSTGTEP